MMVNKRIVFHLLINNILQHLVVGSMLRGEMQSGRGLHELPGFRFDVWSITAYQSLNFHLIFNITGLLS